VSRRTALLLFGIVALTVDAGRASAIPAFARKYHVSCMVCHSGVPRLNATGEAFAANGFRFAPGEEPRDTIATGDPLLRLNNTLPLAVRFDGYASGLTKRAPEEVAIDLQSPWVIKLLSGGQVAKNVSYYMYFLLAERGEVGGLEDAYLQFTDLAPGRLSVIAGQFQVSDPLFKRELRLEYEDYAPYRLKVGDARVDLTYDRGLMALLEPWSGADVALELVTGQGLAGATERRQFDRDNFMNPAIRISQEIGPVRLGAFGYYGIESVSGIENRTQTWGPDATLSLGTKGELNLQYLRRLDDDPFFGRCSALAPCPGGTVVSPSTTVDAGMAELVLWPKGAADRLFFTGLFNWVEADAPVVSLGLGESLDDPGLLTRFRATSVGAHYLLRRNLRVLGEVQWDFDRERARLTAGVVTAF
jgi:hypothetical protein